MDTKQLITFLSLAELQNYQKVSEKLSYAPTTLKSHIQLLEREFGIKLFKKSGRMLQLTPEGEDFRKYAEDMLKIYSDAMHSFEVAKTGKRTMIIGGCDMNILYELNDLFASYNAANPLVQVDMSISSNYSIPERVQQSEVDLGFFYSLDSFPVSGMNSTLLYRERVCVMAQPQHLLAGKAGITYRDLGSYPFVCPHLDCCFTEEILKRVQEACNKKIVPSCVGTIKLSAHQAYADNAILITTERVACHMEEKFRLVRLSLAEDPLYVWQRILYLNNQLIHPAAGGLIRFFTDCCQELPPTEQPV